MTQLTEGGDSATATVSITNNVRFSTAQTVTLQWFNADLGAGEIAGAGGATTLTILAQQASGTLSIHAPQGTDDRFQPPLTKPLAATHGGTVIGSIDLTFVDDEPPPVVSITQAPTEVTEGEGIELGIVLDRGAVPATVVLYAVTDTDSALSGALPPIFLLAGETESTITLTTADNSVQNDGAREVTFALELNPDSPSPYTLGDTSSVNRQGPRPRFSVRR